MSPMPAPGTQGNDGHAQLQRLVERAVAGTPIPILQDTVTISLTFPDLRAAISDLSAIEQVRARASLALKRVWV